MGEVLLFLESCTLIVETACVNEAILLVEVEGGFSCEGSARILAA